MGKSIIEGNEEHTCHNCGRFVAVPHKHHIFGGANRRWSEKYGLWVYLCPECHNMGSNSVHRNKDIMDSYHRLGQFRFEIDYACQHSCGEEQAKAEFMRIFGRNYLD